MLLIGNITGAHANLLPLFLVCWWTMYRRYAQRHDRRPAKHIQTRTACARNSVCVAMSGTGVWRCSPTRPLRHVRYCLAVATYAHPTECPVLRLVRGSVEREPQGSAIPGTAGIVRDQVRCGHRLCWKGVWFGLIPQLYVAALRAASV